MGYWGEITKHKIQIRNQHYAIHVIPSPNSSKTQLHHSFIQCLKFCRKRLFLPLKQGRSENIYYRI